MTRTVKLCRDCGYERPIQDFPAKTKDAQGNTIQRAAYCRCHARERSRRWNREARKRPSGDREGNRRLPIGPFREWLEKLLADNDGNVELTANVLRTSARNLSRWSGRVPNDVPRSVSLDSVDRVLCNAGDPGALHHLYPELWVFDKEAVA